MMYSNKEKHNHILGYQNNHHTHRNIKIAALLNISFTIIEFIGGALTNSLAIIADALHDLGDSLVLISSWKIEKVSLKKPDWKRTFGYRRLSLLAAFLNAVILFGGSIIIFFQVIARIINPQPVHTEGMIILAIIGIIANTLASLQLKKGKSLNEKILSWHLLEDVLGWLGILITAVIIHFTQLYTLDSILTIAFTAFVLWGVWRNSKELFNIFLEGAPSHISISTLLRDIENIKGVSYVYDFHLWSLDGKHHIASLKIITNDKGMENYNKLIHKIKEILQKNHINHSTIEIKEQEYALEKEQEQEFLQK